LTEKQIVAAVLPLSTATSDARRYFVADPYLRFWLRFITPIRGQIDRGIGAAAVPAIASGFGDYAGRAIEPLVRTSIELMVAGGDSRFGRTGIVGGYWNRDNTIEVDLVGADRETPPVKSISFVGTLKWRTRKPLNGHDIAALEQAAESVRGVTPQTIRVGVSRSGFDDIGRPIVRISPDELLAAFPAD
jgi:hypothetical protein